MEKVRSCKLTIFEGPDGSGKTTAAKAYAEETGAKYVHFSSLPRVGQNLARMYVEAMMPAVLGYQDVVFDRCWMSETPYGVVFREGVDRLERGSRRMLERLALRCGAVVVTCSPDFDVVKQNYIRRKHLEMLDDVDQLKAVYDLYGDESTDLPEIFYDFTTHDQSRLVAIEDVRTPCHPIDLPTAGNWDASTIIIGDSFAERKDCDPWYQWPFASFSKSGCSQWLAEQLDLIDISEFELLWFNADQDLSVINDLNKHVIALGEKAARVLHENKIEFDAVPHPQAWKRFNNTRRYPLLSII